MPQIRRTMNPVTVYLVLIADNHQIRLKDKINIFRAFSIFLKQSDIKGRIVRLALFPPQIAFKLKIDFP